MTLRVRPQINWNEKDSGKSSMLSCWQKQMDARFHGHHKGGSGHNKEVAEW
ncbi:hypothetical protein [Rickettsiales endosymbiont of Peranema trichophorum]|uniref:hypothetical protein n=1 Tax=Rickettsiales endosymbiont of Peranema trichophorum TaxID=2486577 RepID=UPI0013EE5F9F|nr:hypothetical protein [Rickettsiales endosymbiont of Peranema trichophorum]